MANHLFPILSPVSGRVVQLSEPPSALVSNQIFGRGPLLEISSSHILAPYSGTVTSISESGDFIQLSHDCGATLTLLIGAGHAFSFHPALKRRVDQGETVNRGQALVAINLPLLRSGEQRQRYLALLLETQTISDTEFKTSVTEVRWPSRGSVSANDSVIFDFYQDPI